MKVPSSPSPTFGAGGFSDDEVLACGKGLRVTRPKTYAYRESGLDTVQLTGIRVYTCPGCKEQYPEIPNIVGLHQVIASHLTRKPAPLTGPEFRFLRKEIGLKAKELAQCLGVTDVSLSRWETGASPISPAGDRLLRTLCSLKTMQAGRAIEPQKFITAFLEDFKRIAPAKAARPMEMTIPANRVAAVAAECVRLRAWGRSRRAGPGRPDPRIPTRRSAEMREQFPEKEKQFIDETCQAWEKLSETYRRRYERNNDPLNMAEFLGASVHAIKEPWVVKEILGAMQQGRYEFLRPIAPATKDERKNTMRETALDSLATVLGVDRLVAAGRT